MARTVRDVMTANPVEIGTEATVREAATLMKDKNIGDVLVMQGQTLKGVITDRDIVVRCIAAGKDCDQTRVREISTTTPVTINTDQSIREAVDLMKRYAIRRLPVMENGRPAGIVSLGDLAVEQDSGSALGRISAAPPQH